MKSKPMGEVTQAELATMNLDAPTNGAVYVMLMAVATVGFVLADVASDVLVQQIANEHFPQLDPRADSPFVDAMTHARLAAMLCAFLFMGFGMSGENYGGDFDFTLSYNDVMLIGGIVAAIPMPFAFFMIDEQSIKRGSFLGFLQMVWSIFQHRGLNLLIGCRFAGGILGGMSAIPVTPIAYYWAGIQPLNDNVVSFVAISAVIAGIRYAEKKGWALDYLKLIIFANLAVLAIDCTLSMSTIWNVLRTQWLWIGLPVMESLPSALEFLILNVIVSEIADPDSKDLTREIVTAVSFLAGSLGIVATKLIDAPFHVSNDDILRDTDNVRGDATATFLIAYGAQLLSIAWLYVLPRHENAAREWKIRHTARSTPLGAALMVVLLLSLCGSVAIHILSVNASTSCLWIAGASGCD